jgi:VanZ like family
VKPGLPPISRKTVLLSWLPAWAGMGVLFYTSSLPGDRIHLPDFFDSDKVVHATAYCVLGILISLRKILRGKGAAAAPIADSSPVPAIAPGRIDFKGLAVGMLYGVADEFHQLFVPLRSYDYADMAADALGVAIGCWLYSRWARRRNARNAEVNQDMRPVARGGNG